MLSVVFMLASILASYSILHIVYKGIRIQSNYHEGQRSIINFDNSKLVPYQNILFHLVCFYSVDVMISSHSSPVKLNNLKFSSF